MNFETIYLNLNMPVMYQVAQNDVFMSGHYAGQDDEGNLFVFESGGTSYTRTAEQIVRCYHVFPMSINVHESQRTMDWRTSIKCYSGKNVESVEDCTPNTYRIKSCHAYKGLKQNLETPVYYRD